MTDAIANTLTPDERKQLAEAEATIAWGRTAWLKVGTALTLIRDARLYRDDYPTFEAYAERKLGFTRQYGYELIAAAAAKESVSSMLDIPQPESARAAGALARVPEAERPAVLVKAAALSADGVPTAKTIDAAWDESREADGAPIVRRDEYQPILKRATTTEPAPVVLATPEAKPTRDGDEWYTTGDDTTLVHAVMGRIDLDPASCAKANVLVRADRYYTLERGEDGLALPWDAETLYCNPPYSNTAEWVERLVAEYRAGVVREAILLVLAKTETAWFDLAWEHGSLCVVRGRISHVAGDGGPEQTGRTGSAFFYFGQCAERFAEVFAHRGRVLPATPWLARPVKKVVAA